MLTTLLLLAPSAQAATHSVEICIKYDILLDGIAGASTSPRDDFWYDNNDHKKARGVKLRISDHGTGTYLFDDFVDDESGCAPAMLFDDTASYSMQVFSEALVEGLGIEVYSSDNELYLYDATFLHWVPTGAGTQDFYVPAKASSTGSADEAFAAVAVASWAFNRNTFGVTPGTVATFHNDECCNATAGRIKSATGTKSTLGHELGHWVVANLYGAPSKNYGLLQEGCDGDVRPPPKGRFHHAVGTQEWQSAAVVEGFADFYNAWLWNKKTENDCMYYMGYSTDFDLDGIVDGDLYSCEGTPLTGLPSWVSARDWLEDAKNEPGNGCVGSLTNKGSEYDWMRFFWDMMTDEDLGPAGVVDLYGAMGPSTFDADNSTPWTTTDDPTTRLQLACASMGITTECDAQDNNGQDH